jgi:hypothetical protein
VNTYFLSFYTIDFTLTCVYIVCATQLTITQHPQPPASKQNLFYPLLWLCWQENIRDNKKDISFLLFWDKYSHTDKFLLLLPCTCVLQPTLVLFYLKSLLLPSPLPILASANLRLLYSLLNREHNKHIQVLGFLSFPYFSLSCSSLSV